MLRVKNDNAFQESKGLWNVEIGWEIHFPASILTQY
jgi:hypothetical protein